MHDPIEKLRLRYALVRLYESRQELTLARQTLDTLYNENPRILGIVRQTADYYWRHDLHRRPRRPETLCSLVRRIHPHRRCCSSSDPDCRKCLQRWNCRCSRWRNTPDRRHQRQGLDRRSRKKYSMRSYAPAGRSKCSHCPPKRQPRRCCYSYCWAHRPCHPELP